MQSIKHLFLDQEAPSGRLVRGLAALGAATAGQLAKPTALGRSTVSTLLSELRDAGIIIDIDARTGGFGRPSQLLSLDPALGRCAGVLLGLGEVRIVICDLTHAVLSDVWIEIERDYTPEQAPDQVRDSLIVECEALGLAIRDLLGLGVAVSAPLSHEGKVLNGDVLPTWCGVDIAEIFSTRLECPLMPENESHCGALAEMTWGAAAGEKDSCSTNSTSASAGRSCATARSIAVSAAAPPNSAISFSIRMAACAAAGVAAACNPMSAAIIWRATPRPSPAIRSPSTSSSSATREGRLGYKRLIEDAAEKVGHGHHLVDPQSPSFHHRR
jgi:hypothetical protein